MITRRTVLKAGAVVALPGLLTASRAAGLDGVPDLLSDDEFPIGFFWPPPLPETTVARYKQIADAGFTFVNSGNAVYNWPASLTMMNACQANGLRALPSDDRIGQAKVCPGWQDGVRTAWEQYAAHPAFAGFRIDDEPSPVDFPRYRMITDVLTQVAPDKLWHFNLVPMYDAGAVAAYKQYIARYVDQLAPSFISFDHYPLGKDGTVWPTYFLNWVLVRAAALQAGVPSWVYVQSVDHLRFRSPTRAELQWQLSMSLAYGAKGIQYFTYWTPSGTEFGAALIDKSGRPTRLYTDARDLNTGFLQPVGRELKHLLSESVVHANEPLPLGTTGFTPTSRLRSVSGSAAVVGQFRRPQDDGLRWVLVANRSYAASASVTVTVTPGIGAVAEFDPATGGYRPVVLGAGGTFPAGSAAGGARLFRLDAPVAAP